MTTETTPNPQTAQAPMTQEETIASLGNYGYGWHDTDDAGANAQRGLSADVVNNISDMKDESDWMRKNRLKALRLFDKKPMPHWGADLSGIDFDNIKYFVRSTEKQANSWEDLPEEIKTTYDRRSEEHTSELQSRGHLVCRLLLEKKKLR